MGLRHIEGPDRDYLTFTEAAEYLRVSSTTLRRLIAAGRFPEGLRPGGAGDPVWHWLTLVSFAHLSPMLPIWEEPLPRLKEQRKSKRGESEENS